MDLEQNILITDDFYDMQRSPEYFIKNQQNTIVNIREITDHIFNLVFEKIDNVAFQKIMPDFLTKQLIKVIDYYNEQNQINKNQEETLFENQYCDQPDIPILDNGQSFCIKKIEMEDIFRPSIVQESSIFNDEDSEKQTTNNDKKLVQELKEYKPVPINIKEKTEEQFYQEMRHQKAQRDNYLKNQYLELQELRKQKKNVNFGSQYATELKDKRFTYGYDGNIIMINRKEPKKQAQSIKIKVENEIEDLNNKQEQRIKIIKAESFMKKKQVSEAQSTENIQPQNVHGQQFDLFQPQKGVTINLENGETKKGSDVKENTLDEIDEHELTVNDKIRMTKREYKNLTIIRNSSVFYDKYTSQVNESSQLDILNDLLKNDMSLQTNRQYQDQSLIKPKINNSLQIFDKKQYDLLIKQDKEFTDRYQKKYSIIDESNLNFSKIDQFNQDIVQNQKHLIINNTSRQIYQKPIQRLIVHQNKKINKSIPLKCVKYPREPHKEESMALLKNQKSFLSHRNHLNSTKDQDRYSFSVLSKNILY